MVLDAAARTTISSLKPQRSSRLPPPRATIRTSGRGMGPSIGKCVEAANGGGDFGGGRFTLHTHRPDEDASGKAFVEAVQHVTDDGAGGRGDDADNAGQEWQFAFLCLIEEAFCAELLLALFEQRHQGADAGGLQRFDHDLVFGRTGERRDFTGGDDFKAFLRLEAEGRENAAPDHGVDLGLVVLQCEVAVAGGMGAAIAGDFAANADVAVRRLQRLFDRTGELGDRQFGDVGAGTLRFGDFDQWNLGGGVGFAVG